MRQNIFFLVIILTTNFYFSALSAQDHHDCSDHLQRELDPMTAENRVNDFIESDLFNQEIESRIGIDATVFKNYNPGIVHDILYVELINNGNKYSAADELLDAVFEALYMRESELDLRKALDRDYSATVNNKEVDGPCVNMDFETGDTEGWTLTEASVNATPGGLINTFDVAAPQLQHTIVGIGTDSLTGISTTNPDGGEYSLLLGDLLGTNKRASMISQTFLVSEENTTFTYSYAVVLADPGHVFGEQPFFSVSVLDEDNNPTTCGQFFVASGAQNTNQPWQTINYLHPGGSMVPAWFKDWETTYISLDNLIGQNVTIQIAVGDCSQSGHFGYAYVDAECASSNLIPPGTMICHNETLTLTAPAGAASYNWNTDETTQSIEVDEAGNYEVTVTQLNDPTCAITLNADLVNAPARPVSDFAPIDSTLCLGTELELIDLSYVTGQFPITSWQWDFGDDSDGEEISSPTHLFNEIGEYEVELVVELSIDTLGTCFDTTRQVIRVNPNPIVNFESNNVCFDFATEFIDQSSIEEGSIEHWAWDFNNTGNTESNDQHPVYIYQEAGEHSSTLTVTSAEECSTSGTLHVTVYPAPVSSFETLQKNVSIMDPVYDFINTSELNDINTWTFSDLGFSNEIDPSFEFPNEDHQIYEVCLEVETEHGCIDQSCQNVLVEGVASYFIPSSFTPNEDGLNDLFAPITFGLDPDQYSFKVYDRWGTTVFSTTSIDEKWNGNDGTNYYSIDDVYNYTLLSKNIFTGETIVSNGHVTVLR